MLFEPDRHEDLCGDVWDASRAREAIRAIVHDIEQKRTGGCRWPAHPLDDEGDVPRTGFKSLYLGSAGVLWALGYLQRRGAVQLRIDPCEGIRDVCAAYEADPDTGEVVPSYYLGEVGVLLVRGCLTGWAEVADRIYASVRSNHMWEGTSYCFA